MTIVRYELAWSEEECMDMQAVEASNDRKRQCEEKGKLPSRTDGSQANKTEYQYTWITLCPLFRTKQSEKALPRAPDSYGPGFCHPEDSAGRQWSEKVDEASLNGSFLAGTRLGDFDLLPYVVVSSQRLETCVQILGPRSGLWCAAACINLRPVILLGSVTWRNGLYNPSVYVQSARISHWFMASDAIQRRMLLDKGELTCETIDIHFGLEIQQWEHAEDNVESY
ncbi:hypothetical protein N7535_003082 [Penicillium sp. DV-2018c]|nr:hypothetical protein N7461_001225 [Penicillium sp. DV-2018c]KAJ5576156.1 hypothetical protein N7535_003082 [Penicillium sp. DV-2018c]